MDFIETLASLEYLKKIRQKMENITAMSRHSKSETHVTRQ